MKVKLRSSYICVLMGGVIISLSGVRYLLGIQESNILIYGLYALYITSSFFLYQKKYKNIKFLKAIPTFGLLLISYGLVTSIIGGTQDIVNAIKLVLIFLTAIAFYLMSVDNLRHVINVSYTILVIYILSIILRPNRINYYLNAGSNYLVLSLPIGMLLAMMLARIVYRLYRGLNIKEILLDALIALMALMALTKITGRGSIIFPFFTTGIILLMLGRKHIFKTILLIGLFVLFTFAAYKFFLSHASGYVLAHLLTIFGGTSGESRWGIWRKSIDYIVHDLHWLIGGGIGAAVRNIGAYPHNIYLHCLVEFGLIGGLCSAYITLYAGKIQFDVIKHPLYSNRNMMLFTEFSAGTIYMLLNFMKSFPVYDSVVLMIMTFGLLSVYFQCKKQVVVSKVKIKQYTF